MRWLYPVLLLSLLMSLLGGGIAAAENVWDVAVWSGDWNGVDVTVTVVAKGHTIPDTVKQTEPWWRWGNTETDGYMFSFNGNEAADMVLIFSTDGELPIARLFVPVEESQRRGFLVREGDIDAPAHTHPRIIVSPRDGGWLIDGMANFDLDVSELDSDGQPIWQAIVGAERPGLPKWVTSTLLRDSDTSQGYVRFGASVREDSSVVYELASPLMPSWPYLSVGKNRSHWAEDRPMFFDLAVRQLVINWAGFQTAGVYAINSICYPPKVCFESPFAWYRFDPSAGRYANLVVRGDTWPSGVPFGPSLPEFQRTTLRMTWTGIEAYLWRYSLTVAANHPMDQEILIGDTVVESVPYEELPSWIASRPWKAVTFVEATQGERGSEGIYDYSVEDDPIVADWVNGLRSVRPGSFQYPSLRQRPSGSGSQTEVPSASLFSPYLKFPTIHPNRLYDGFRGEYSLAYNRVPQLYLSPVDNRPHLLHAEAGLWNLGGGVVLRTHNLGGGRYINGWSRERLPMSQATFTDDIVIAVAGEPEEELYTLDGYFLYSGSPGFELRKSAAPVSSPEVPVPVDEASWRTYLEGTGSLQGRDPQDMQSWLNGFPGSSLRIAEGRASDVRVTSDGFRFVLVLPLDFNVHGDDLLGIRGLQPGRFAVTYSRHNGGFRIEPLTPPSFVISSFPQGLLLEPGVEARANTVGFRITNEGQEDAKGVSVVVTAESDTGKLAYVGEQRLTVLAGEATRAAFRWTPPDTGSWKIRISASLADEDGEILALAEYEEMASIAGLVLPTPSQAVAAFGAVPPLALAGLVFALLTVTFVTFMYLARYRSFARENKEEARPATNGYSTFRLGTSVPGSPNSSEDV